MKDTRLKQMKSVSLDSPAWTNSRYKSLPPNPTPERELLEAAIAKRAVKKKTKKHRRNGDIYRPGMNGPLTTIYSDGSFAQQDRLTSKELGTVIRRGKQQPQTGLLSQKF